MPPEHSKEHPMVAVEVFCTGRHKIQSSFSKPVSPQWSYQVDRDEPIAGFIWGKRKPLPEMFNASHMSSVEYETVNQISSMTNKDHIPNPEKHFSLVNKSLPFKQASETAPTQWTFEKKHKIFLSHAGAEKDFVSNCTWIFLECICLGSSLTRKMKVCPKEKYFPRGFLMQRSIVSWPSW